MTTQLDISSLTRLRALAGAMDLQSLREAGLKRFSEVGLPTAKDEEWRFTNTDPIAEIAWQLPTEDADANELITQHAVSSAIELVLVNGRLLSGQTSEPGLYVGLLSQAPSRVAEQARARLATAAPVEKTPFTALNAGLLSDVVLVHIGRGSDIEKPIHLLSIHQTYGTALLFCPRVLVIVEEDAVARLIETHAGSAEQDLCSNSVVEVFVGKNAVLDHYQAHWNGEKAFSIDSTIATLEGGATYSHHSAVMSGRLVRNDLEVALDGERADATLNGMVLADGSRHVDNHTLIRHEKPNCTSHELYKHVVADEAFGVFKGKIFVQKDAQHTDSKQTSRTLLLSDRAMMESMPALEIYADDVKCTHGSTTGPLDEDMLFYLQSRGLSREASRHLLVYAFAADLTARMKARPVRQRIESYLAAKQDLPQDLSIEAI